MQKPAQVYKSLHKEAKVFKNIFQVKVNLMTSFSRLFSNLGQLFEKKTSNSFLDDF
jgi:hypothetical protein